MWSVEVRAAVLLAWTLFWYNCQYKSELHTVISTDNHRQCTSLWVAHHTGLNTSFFYVACIMQFLSAILFLIHKYIYIWCIFPKEGPPPQHTHTQTHTILHKYGWTIYLLNFFVYMANIALLLWFVCLLWSDKGYNINIAYTWKTS